MPPLGPVKLSLKYLNLRSNYLRKIATDFFHGFIRLATLDLTRNDLSNLPDLSPVAQTLTNFKAANNDITTISPAITNASFSMLFRLNVERNDIKQLNLVMFSSWPNLALLHIDFNLIETLEDMSLMTHGRGRVLKVGFKSSPPGQNGRFVWQTTFSNAFSGMKMIKFRFKFHWNLFPGVQLTINHHWFR